MSDAQGTEAPIVATDGVETAVAPLPVSSSTDVAGGAVAPAPLPSTEINFRVGERLDILDSRTWRTAVIIEVKDAQFKIHFENWGDNWDEWMHTDMKHRYAFIGTHTAGKWTGSGPGPTTYQLASSLEPFREAVRHVEAIHHKVMKQESLTVDEYNYLSGSGVGQQMIFNALNAEITSPALIPEIQNLLEKSLDMTARSLMRKEDFHPGHLDTLPRIFGSRLTDNFYLTQGLQTEGDSGSSNGPYAVSKQSSSPTSTYLLHNINYFGSKNGFHAIADVFHQFSMKPAEEEKASSSSSYAISLYSFYTIERLIKALSACAKFWPPEFSVNYAKSLDLPLLLKRILSNISDKELRTLDKNSFASLQQDIELIMQPAYKEVEIAEFIERINLDVALRLISAKVLAKVLEGLDTLQRTIDAVTKVALGPEKAAEQYPPPPPPAYTAGGYHYNRPAPAVEVVNVKYLTPPSLVEWIRENKVTELLLQKDSHEQVFKRCAGLMKFLAQFGGLSVVHLDSLWDTTLANQHEGRVRVAYEIIAEIAQELKEDQLDALYARIVTRPLKDYKDYDINFLKQFTINAVKATHTQQGEEKQRTDKWFGLDIFWHMFQDDVWNDISREIRNFSQIALKEMLVLPLFQSQRVVYLEKCVNNLKKGTSVVTSLSLMSTLLETEKLSNHTIITDFATQHQLLDLVLQNYVLYMKEAAQAKKSGKYVRSEQKAADETKEDQLTVFAGRQGHGHQMHSRLMFIKFILTHTNLVLTQQQMNILWDVCVRQAVTNNDSDTLFKWFEGCLQEAQEKPDHSISREMIEYIFAQYLCSGDAHISATWYACWQAYFIAINHAHNNLQSNSNSFIIVLNYTNLKGMDALWRYAISSLDLEVSALAPKFLCTLTIHLFNSLPPQEKANVYETFTNRCVAQLQKSYIELMKAKNTATTAAAAAATTTTTAAAAATTTTTTATAATDLNMKMLAETVGILHQFVMRLESREQYPLYFPGEKICAYWKEQTQKSLWPGTVKAVNADGTYQIQFDDGDFMGDCKEQHIATRDKIHKNRTSMADWGEDDTTYVPRTILSKDKPTFDLFFQLLGLGGAVSPGVWGLLSTLPLNSVLTDSLKKIAFIEKKDNETEGGNAQQSEVNWQELFPSIPFKLLYTLRIVEQHILRHLDSEDAIEEKHMSKNWCHVFVTKGGFEHLMNIFLHIPVSEILSGDLPQQCLKLGVSILCWFLARQDLNNGRLSVSREFVSYLLEIISSVCKLTLSSAITQNVDVTFLLHAAVVREVSLMIQTSIDLQPALLELCLQYNKWGNMIETVINNPNTDLRREIRLFILNLCTKNTSTASSSYFLREFLTRLPSIKTHINYKANNSAIDFFEVVESLLQIIGSGGGQGTEAISSYNVSYEIVRLLKQHPILESSDADEQTDPMLCSLLKLATQIVKQDISLKQNINTNANTGGEILVNELLSSLFEVPSTFTNSSKFLHPPKCKTKISRQWGFECLAELIHNAPALGLRVIATVTPFHQIQAASGGSNGAGAVKRRGVWDFEPISAEEKARAGYVGLKNLGCICYMNAAMQQVFMIPRLRHNVLAIDTYEEEDHSKSLIYTLQTVLAQLQETSKSYTNPKIFTDVWTDDEGQPVNVRKQEDSSGFVIKLIDRMDDRLKKTIYKDSFRDVLGGTFSHELIGRGECTHFRERDEEFYTIQVEIENKKTLQESLHAFVQGDLLEGGNAFKCDACAKKVDTLKRVTIKKLPRTLMITLKRFSLDFETMETKKMDDRLEFPMDLDMKPYTSEEMRKSLAQAQEKREEEEGKAKAGESSGEGKTAAAAATTAAAANKPNVLRAIEHADEYYKYKLKGVVIHTGTANSGHYYSFIQERTPEGKWYRFDDTLVTEWDTARLAYDCFGGKNNKEMHFGGAPNAYLLIYDRVESPSLDENNSNITNNNKSSSVSFTRKNTMKVLGLCYLFTSNLLKKSQAARLRVSVPPKIMSDIWAQNYLLMRDKIAFNKHYENFLWRLVSDSVVDTEKPSSLPALSSLSLNEQVFSIPCSYRDAVTRLATQYCINTLSRWTNKEPDERWIHKLKQLYINNISSCVWFLNLFATTPLLIWEFFFTCPRAEFRDLIGTISAYALQQVSPLERGLQQPQLQQETKEAEGGAGQGAGQVVLGTCSKRFIAHLAKHATQLTTRGFDHKLEHEGFLGDAFFRVIADYLFLGQEEARFGYSLELLFKILDMYMADESPFQPQYSANSPMRHPFLEGADLTCVVRSIDLLLQVEQPSDLQLRTTQMAHEMLKNQRFLNNFLLEGPALARMSAMHSVIRRICTESKEITVAVLDAVKRGLEEHSYFKFRAYTDVMNVLLSINDSLCESRVDLVFTWLFASLDAQREYWKEMDYLIAYIISSARSFPLVASWLRENGTKLEQLVDWLNDHPSAPSTRQDQFGFKLRKSRTRLAFHNRCETWLQSPEFGPHYLNVDDKKLALQMIIRGDPLDQIPPMIHPDFSTRTFVAGESVDVLDTGDNWRPARVERVYGRFVTIHYFHFTAEWDEELEMSSLRLAPANTIIPHTQEDNYAHSAPGGAAFING